MLETMVRNIRFPDVAIPQPADLTPVIARLDSIEAVLAAIPKPPPVDLDPVMARLGKLERAIAKAADHHATYNFDIKRDDSGKITEVTATEKPVLLMGM